MDLCTKQEDLEVVERLQLDWIRPQGRREHHRSKRLGHQRRPEHPCLALTCHAWNLTKMAEADSCGFGMDWGSGGGKSGPG